MKQAKKYPAPQISEAVFRGRNSLYNFEVYPMNVQFNEVPAVYIISKRKIDRHGRGHHFLVCIGQTESLVEDIKKHKRGKCVKQLQANTVSVILEDDEQKRVEVENDLKSAHTIPCHHDASGAEFVLKPIEKAVSPKTKPEARKILPAPQTEIPAKPLKKLAKKPSEAKPEVKIETPQPKKAKKISAPVKAKANSEKIIPAPKKEKKAETIKPEKFAPPNDKTVDKKIETKAQKVKTQKTEALKAKKTSANTGKTKVDKKTVGKKIEASTPKNVKQAKAKIEKKSPTPKTVQALKKPSASQIKPKAKGKVEASKSKSVAPKINKAKADKPKVDKVKAEKVKVNKTKTVAPPQKPAKKVITAKLPKTVKALKTKADNSAKSLKTKTNNKAKALKTNSIGKAKVKTKISVEAKTKPKTGKAKADANSAKIKDTKASKITKSSKINKPKTSEITKTAKNTVTKASKTTKPSKVNQAKANEIKAKGKTEAPKVKANTKAKISIKPSVKGKVKRLQTSSRKRLAF